MPSDKLTRILRSKSTLSAEEIAAMSEAEGWKWIYDHAPPKKERLPEICFTGFEPLEKEELSILAKDCGFKVVTCVTKNLDILCTGDAPGWAKLEKAKAQGVIIINQEQFKNFLDTGEIPNG